MLVVAVVVLETLVVEMVLSVDQVLVEQVELVLLMVLLVL
jgi:hypothetical protein